MNQSFFKYLLFAPVLLLAGPSAAEPEIPADDKVLSQTGHSNKTKLPSNFKILVWNIHKAEDGPAWQRDFHHLASNNDVILLQEGYQVQTYKEVIGQLPNVLWSFATSFVYRGFETGVVTGSSAKPVNTRWLRSPGREPLVQSPKMTILSEFDIIGSDENLLVANIHGINFVTNGTFYDHVTQVVMAIEKHKGPLIFAGDFNTWNSSRRDFLQSHCDKLGLSMVDFKIEPRNNPIDHIFYRGLVPNNSEVLAKINTSDHLPLSVEFSVSTSNQNPFVSVNKKTSGRDL